MSLRQSLLVLSVVTGLGVVACGEADPEADDAADTDLARAGFTLSSGGIIVAPPPNPTAIPATGTLPAALAGVDDAVKAFMRASCTGAVSLALGFGNGPVMARGYGYKSGPPNQACATAGDPFIGGTKVGPNTAFRLGSNSKAITAAIVRIVLKQKLASLGRPTTDAELESLRVFDPALGLVSSRLVNAVNGQTGGNANTVCVPGRNSPVLPSGRPDIRWRDMTVGHFLGHRSGLPRSSNPVTSKLAAMRNIYSLGALNAEAQLLDAPASPRNDIASAPGGDGRFIRQATLEETIFGNLDLCLERAPGEDPGTEEAYSNFGYGVLQHIAEHVSGRSLAAPLGSANGHDASLLGQFLTTRLGVTKGADSAEGIYFSQPLEDLRDPSEPRYRAWDGVSQNGTFWDTKRPWCNWTGTGCNGNLFDSGDRRYNWDWTKQKVPVSYENAGFSGVGLLAAEMPLYLRFMAKYWVSGSGDSPFYGRERAANPTTQTRWHIGELAGTHSTVASFNGAWVPFFQVPRKANGELDLDNFTPAFQRSCRLPAKLDLALAANQVTDAACAATEEGVCSDRYMALRDVVKEALCEVDWSKVNPILELTAAD